MIETDENRRLGRVRAGLAPARRIYRNYGWVMALACLLVVLWGAYTVGNYGSFMKKDYFDEQGTLEKYSVSIMLAEQSEDLPRVERWMLGDVGKEEATRGAVEYLEYADGKELLTAEGKVMLACAHWSSGNEGRAGEVVAAVSSDDSFYAGVMKDLMAGRELDQYSWDTLAEQLRFTPRDWVACFLSGKAAEKHPGERADDLLGLVDERRQSLLIASAKIVIIDWLVVLTGSGCIVFLLFGHRADGGGRSHVVPRLPRLWPLTFVLILFVLGELLAEFVSYQVWEAYAVLGVFVPYTGYSILADIMFRCAGAVLFLWFFFRRPDYAWRTLFRPVPNLWQWVLAAFTVVWMVDILWYSLPAEWFPFDPTIGYQWNEYGWEGLLTSMISAVILAPLGEELIFRGLLFNGLKNRLGLHAAAVISAVIFGSVHFYGVQDMISVGFFGLLMAYLYHHTRSLWPCILCHALVNFLITSWEWIVTLSPPGCWEIR